MNEKVVGVIFDIAVLTSITVLVGMKILSQEEYLLVVGPMVGAMAANRRNSGGGLGGVAGAVNTGAMLAIVGGLGSLLRSTGMRAVLTITLVITVANCKPAAYARAASTASIVTAVSGFRAANDVCVAIIEKLANSNPAEAIAFGGDCQNALIPARDGLRMAVREIENWNPGRSEPVVACAGLAAGVSFGKVCKLVASKGYRCGQLVEDATEVALRLGETAEPLCDALYPTTSINTVRPSIPGTEL